MLTHNHQPTSYYQIVIRGHLHEKWADWFSGLTITSEDLPDGSAITYLTGPLKDQAALRGVLIKLWDLNLDLISVQSVPPSPECTAESAKSAEVYRISPRSQRTLR
ncbi:MAG: hypothetical protein JXR84_08890 [Anaerolineae bacterium]|nr:hypothetical protein [Anaerolineae bacterium]